MALWKPTGPWTHKNLRPARALEDTLCCFVRRDFHRACTPSSAPTKSFRYQAPKYRWDHTRIDPCFVFKVEHGDCGELFRHAVGFIVTNVTIAEPFGRPVLRQTAALPEQLITAGTRRARAWTFRLS